MNGGIVTIRKRVSAKKAGSFYCSGLFTIKEEIIDLGGGQRRRLFRIEGIGKSKSFERYIKDRSTQRKGNET
jgi:hypothetical protein